MVRLHGRPHMNEFDREKYRKEEFENLKLAFKGIGRDGWSTEEMRRRMNAGEVQDLIVYRKADFGHNTGTVLAKDFARAMDDLQFTPDERKRVATYFISHRIGDIDEKSLRESGWLETIEFLKGILSG